MVSRLLIQLYTAQRKHAKRKLQEYTDAIADSLRAQALKSDTLDSFSDDD
jgi:hypothetical protein